MLDKLEAINQRFLEVEKLISSPNAMDDMKSYVQLSKEYKDLEPIIKIYKMDLSLSKQSHQIQKHITKLEKCT